MNLCRYISNPILRQRIKMFGTAFPGHELLLEDMVVEGDIDAVKSVLRGIHLSKLMGIPATGKKVTIPFMLMVRLENGKIADYWMDADNLRLFQQLNVF